MQLSSRALWDLLLTVCFLLLQVHSRPQEAVKDNKEICLLPAYVGFCKAIIPRWYYDHYTQTCREFDYGGCEGNDNNFPTEEDCERTCHKIKRVPKICRLEVDKGKGGASYRRYYFNLNTMTCEHFNYEGCTGNENRFYTKFSCMDYCLPEKSISTLMGSLGMSN